MALYTIEPDQGTLHDAFSRDIAPILSIDSGDTVRFRTLDADWNLASRQSTRYDEQPAQFTPRPAGQEDGHPLCGPVAVPVILTPKPGSLLRSTGRSTSQCQGSRDTRWWHWRSETGKSGSKEYDCPTKFIEFNVGHCSYCTSGGADDQRLKTTPFPFLAVSMVVV